MDVRELSEKLANMDETLPVRIWCDNDLQDYEAGDLLEIMTVEVRDGDDHVSIEVT